MQSSFLQVFVVVSQMLEQQGVVPHGSPSAMQVGPPPDGSVHFPPLHEPSQQGVPPAVQAAFVATQVGGT